MSRSGRNFYYSFLLIFMFGFLPVERSEATHLMGGELTYMYSGSQNGVNFYDVRLIIYRYCDSTIVTAPLDQTMFLGIYIPAGSDLAWYATENLLLVGSDFINAPAMGNGCNFTTSACIEKGEYIVTIMLPDTTTPFHLFVERCCRNGNIINLANPGQTGMSFSATIPAGIINSSPQITDVSVPYVCSGDSTSIINNAFDPDGDSLAYSFVIPYNGNSSTSIAAPDPAIDNNPYILPINPITYNAGYAFPSFLGAGGSASIDPVTGLTNYVFPLQGFYVAAIEISEYRNGVLISSIRRDLQFISVVCQPNFSPNFIPSANGTAYSIPEGQLLCFNVDFADADGDSIHMIASGPLLDTNMVNPAGTFTAGWGSGNATSTFCWRPVCGMARPAPYQFSVSATDDGCPPKTTNVIFSIFVTNSPASQYPSVTVTQSPPGIICQGSHVTFEASPTLPGTAPQYTWYMNGAVAATGDSIFTPANITTGDIISVTMVSNAPCLLNDTAQSPPFVIQVNPQPAPVVSLSSMPSNMLCPHQICLFTSSVTNGGASPSYTWYLNDTIAGTNNFQFTAANPAGIMAVYVVVTPSTGCPPENSDTIVFNIQPIQNPEVHFVSNNPDSVCPGQQLSLQVASTGTGNPPQYNWFMNGTSMNHNFDSLTFNVSPLGDSIVVQVTSTYECLSPEFAYTIPYEVSTYPPLAADLTDGPIDICEEIPLELVLSVEGGNPVTYTYSWSPTPGNKADNTFYPDHSGWWYATVDDICYDPITDSVMINSLPKPEALFTYTPTSPSVYLPEVLFTNLSLDSDSWLWNFGDGSTIDDFNPVHSFIYGGEYRVELTAYNNYGCSDTTFETIIVDHLVLGFIPNSFTPNGDGRNDSFGVEGDATGGYSLHIFNRWGQEIFSSSGGYKRWDGTDGHGRQAPEGTYSYVTKLENDPTQKLIKGTVTLIR